MNSYNLNNKKHSKELNLKKLITYGDTMNDGKIQISFTLPVTDNEKSNEAALILARKMGIQEPQVVCCKPLDKNFTYYIIYGSLIHTVNYEEIKVKGIKIDTMSMNEINEFIKNNFNKKLIVLGASTGTDAHTVGIDAIMNMKGYAGHYGLERYGMIEAYNLGSQVDNEMLIEKAINLKVDVILVSQTVTQKNIHIKNLVDLVELLEAEGIRQDIVLICGGPRITNNLAKELGYDAGFGPGKYAEDVATYFIKELFNRKRMG